MLVPVLKALGLLDLMNRLLCTSLSFDGSPVYIYRLDGKDGTCAISCRLFYAGL